MERLIIRIEKNKKFIEYNKPLLIFVDDIDAAGLVTCASYTGHTSGEYSALIKQTRPITPAELVTFNGYIYGYNLADFKIIKRRAGGFNNEK